ncbi:SdiA-regulated domain-containing protein [Fulvivirga lutea]|uniref:SdiA-regulated domain-containing protein n=1 Tax=Fulvivirga lutea TaxID=2810512 RepID=A0A974WI26_9BACT|nr:SdiA-regulated domain-containing protein [Fulvivirga lutea]QSE98535.1 SdiA-regulated domain-containing protein [Fulvivirga lutea]
MQLAIKYLIVTFFTILFLQCDSFLQREIHPKYKDYDTLKVPYTLYAPKSKVKLHWDLEEVSGLSYYMGGQLLAVEDETGNVYVLDAETGDVNQKVKFNKGGDYEGVEYDGVNVWVMESDGTFYSFQIENSEADNVREYKSAFSSKNDLEGLGYIRGNLLVAAKGEGTIAGVENSGKGVYTIKNNDPVPFLFIERDTLENYIKGRDHFYEIRDFDPSGIAIHPLNNDIYILSADHILVVYTSDLKLKEVVKLDGVLMEQPEGICFSPEGVLYISSEGNDSRGELFIFHYLSTSSKE